MKLFIVTAADTGETADGKARILGTYKNRKDAVKYVKEDMKCFVNDAHEMDLHVDYDKMSIHTANYMYGCEWNIEEIEVPLPNKKQIKKTEKVLIDNGVEKDEASTVLQAIGYTLLDMELYPC